MVHPSTRQTLCEGTPTMKFYLIVAKGKRAGMPIPIEIDLFLIGSANECQLRADHSAIGEQHCALVSRSRKVFIRDLNSGQVTLVNGSVLPVSEEWPLHLGDRIAVGPLEFVISYHEKQLSQRDLEEWALKTLDENSERRTTAFVDLQEALNSKGRSGNASDAASSILQRLSAQKGIVKGRLRLSREEGITIIRINDIYLVDDAELSLLKKELLENLAHANLRILLDFKNVKRMTSHATQIFSDLVTWLRPWGSTLAFCRLRSELQQMMTGMPGLERIRFFADKQAAIDNRW